MFRPIMPLLLTSMLAACAAVPALPLATAAGAAVSPAPPRATEAEPSRKPTVIPTIGIPPVPPRMPYAPQPGDERLSRGNVYIDSATLLLAESYPPQVFLVLSGSLPTPCHQLRVEVSAPDAQNRIRVEAYSRVDPNVICVQVLKAFEASIRLGSYASGHYTVWLNGRRVGEFDS